MINIAFIREVGPLRWAMRTAIRQYYKRVVKRDHSIQLPTGEWMTLPIGDHFASEAFITQGDVDWGSEKLFASLLNRKGVFLDVGAHIGYYSLYMMPRVTEIYAFEPDPQIRELLEMNLSGRPNVMVIPWAAGERPGRARFTMGRGAETLVASGDTGEDIDGLTQKGVPSFAPVQDSRTYFNYHHTAADTFDKVDPKHLNENAAVVAVLAYALADSGEPAPR